MKNRSQNALLLIGSIVLSLIIGELVARNFEAHLCRKLKEKNKNNFLTLFPDLRGITEKDEQDGYRPRPNASVEVFGESFRTDSLGCRTGIPAPDSAKKILFIGDSMVFGTGLVDSLTPPSQLQSMLNTLKPEHPCRVINGGVMGYSFLNDLHETQRLAPKIKPDLILVGLCFNDEFTNMDPYKNVDDVFDHQLTAEEKVNSRQSRKEMKRAGLYSIFFTCRREIVSFFDESSALFRFIEYTFKQIRDMQRKKINPDELKKHNATKTKTVVTEFVDLLDAYKCPYAFIYFPTPTPKMPLPYVQILKERGLPLLDLTNSSGFSMDSFFFVDLGVRNNIISNTHDCHLNPDGSKVFAEMVADWLVEKGLW